MTEFESAKMGNSYPNVLVCFVGVGRSHTGLGGESELGNTISVHLLWVARKEGVLFIIWFLWILLVFVVTGLVSSGIRLGVLLLILRTVYAVGDDLVKDVRGFA